MEKAEYEGQIHSDGKPRRILERFGEINFPNKGTQQKGGGTWHQEIRKLSGLKGHTFRELVKKRLDG